MRTISCGGYSGFRLAGQGPRGRNTRFCELLERFSSEVDAGSREENASKKEIQSFDAEFS
jgi:hypothetical protein